MGKDVCYMGGDSRKGISSSTVSVLKKRSCHVIRSILQMLHLQLQAAAYRFVEIPDSLVTAFQRSIAATMAVTKQ